MAQLECSLQGPHASTRLLKYVASHQTTLCACTSNADLRRKRQGPSWGPLMSDELG